MEYVLYHHGVKGMKWGVRKKRHPMDKSEKPLTRRQVKKSIEKAKREGRLTDYTWSNDIWGIRQKNGDILFVDANDVRKLGVDAAEKKTREYVEQARAAAKKSKAEKLNNGKNYVDKALQDEERKLVKELRDTYDKSDPDYDEAMALLDEIEAGFD